MPASENDIASTVAQLILARMDGWDQDVPVIIKDRSYDELAHVAWTLAGYAASALKHSEQGTGAHGDPAADNREMLAEFLRKVAVDDGRRGTAP